MRPVTAPMTNRRGASVPRSNGPHPEVRPPRADVRLKALDSGQPFPGSVAGISDRSLFLPAPRTYELAHQVPLSLPSDTSHRTKVPQRARYPIKCVSQETLTLETANSAAITSIK